GGGGGPGEDQGEPPRASTAAGQRGGRFPGRHGQGSRDGVAGAAGQRGVAGGRPPGPAGPRPGDGEAGPRAGRGFQWGRPSRPEESSRGSPFGANAPQAA